VPAGLPGRVSEQKQTGCRMDNSYTDDTTSVIVIVWIAFACYVLVWFYTLFGFVYLLSIRWFVKAWWIIKYGIPWTSPKILSIWVQLLGLAGKCFLSPHCYQKSLIWAVRATWIMLMLQDGPIQAQYIFVNMGFLIMISHLSMVLCYW